MLYSLLRRRYCVAIAYMHGGKKPNTKKKHKSKNGSDERKNYGLH